MKALLHSVPLGRLVVLDLFAEVKPLWPTSDQFYGIPYIWCMLHNFAGNSEMYGVIDAVGSGPVEARMSKNSTMVHHPDTRKPAFRWLGMREKLEDGSANSFVPIESKKRTFGTEVTNTSFKRTKLIDGNLNQITKPQMQMQVKREVLGNEFDKTNLERDSRECPKSYQFGPFAPVSVSKAFAAENKKVKQVHD